MPGHAPPLAAVLLQGAMPGAIVSTHPFENGKGPGKMMETCGFNGENDGNMFILSWLVDLVHLQSQTLLDYHLVN